MRITRDQLTELDELTNNEWVGLVSNYSDDISISCVGGELVIYDGGQESARVELDELDKGVREKVRKLLGLGQP